MRAKTVKKPSRSVQYLLSADRNIRKLSLKRIPPRRKSAHHPHARGSAQLSAVSELKQAAASPAGITLSAVLVLGGAIVAAMLVAAPTPYALRTAAPAAARSIGTAPEESIATRPGPDSRTPVAPAADAARAAKPAVEPTAASKPNAEPSTKNHTEAATVPPAESKAAHLPATETVAKAAGAGLAPAAATEAANAATVTVGGCLELKDSRFRLTDTSGGDAPKSRSWKSGFLKKHASAITVVDPANALALPAHVGQRVSATGTITDGEMRARSLQRISASCR